ERFLEKPTWGQVFSDTINTGIYVLEPEIFDFIPDGRPVDFSGESFPAVLAAGKPLYGFVADGYWEDVGTLEAYLKAHQDILDQRVRVDIAGFELRPRVWLGKGSLVDPTVDIVGPAIIGDNCVVGPGVKLGEYCSLGRNVRIGDNAALQRSVVHENSYLGPAVRVDGSVLGRACDLRTGARCEEGVVLGEHCFVGAQAELKAGVMVYPFKTVEAGAIVNSSIVWESRGARSLFGRDGVQGLANVDISAELAVRLSMAWASTLEKGSTVTTSRDTSRAARVLKRAVMVGCNSAGVNVDDLEAATVPVTRFQVASSSSLAGITVRLTPDDPESVVLRFFDERGIDIDETAQRKIERLYYREDFRRALAREIGDIGFPNRAVEYYTAALIDSVDLAHSREANLKLVLDFSFGTASFVMPNLLSKLEADVLVVNPYANTASATTFDRRASADRVAELVKASGAHLGAVLDPGGEQVTFVDDEGHVLSDDEAVLVMLTLVTDAQPGARVALPVVVSRAAEEICRRTGTEIVWTKLATSHLMEVASTEDVILGASEHAGFIFPGFMPAFDAAATLVNLLALLTRTGRPLSHLVGTLPNVHIAHQSVHTPWEQKGTVMRTLVEGSEGRDLVLLDGVKVLEPGGWALVIPDPEEPVTHVWAEAATDAQAGARAQEYAVRIRQLMR
ncbi:MAG TPA: mannose-1-phosphate guanyltransferase, partial [Acidimicrobiales bacterium]|nr:mannose-1-phosphate guanyltransferase [Acidimicrobiales bacterium]